MKIDVRLTLDGMVRALRWQAHAAAEEMELRRSVPAKGQELRLKTAGRPGGGNQDERPGE